MTDPTTTNDIDALLDLLAVQSHIRFHSALTALVAERDALRKGAVVLKSQEFTLPSDPFRDDDRNLRERLVCAALTGLMAQPAHGDRELWANHAVSFADATLAAMRKGVGEC